MKSEHSHEQDMRNPSASQLEKLVSIEHIYAQMVLDEILINQWKEILKKKIDESLDKQDEAAFMRLSGIYNEMNR
ncbi:MAG: IDEAL domain-containing protein [Tuberibacillus sp.]